MEKQAREEATRGEQSERTTGESRWRNLMRGLTRWLDPRLEKYREAPEPEMPELYLPETTEDLVWLLRKLPESVLTGEEKRRIGAAMSFETRQVRDLMVARDEMTLVYENDFLGPLMLDQLYKSGQLHFPVMGAQGQVVGVLHTEALNKLEVRETDRARNYLDEKLYYLRDDYSLEQAFAAVLRTNCYFFLVVNRMGTVVGMLSFNRMIEELTGKVPEDTFAADDDLMAVAKR